jgi:hypothetical protein
MKRIAFALTLILLLALALGAIGCTKEEATPSPSPTPTALSLEITQPEDGDQVNTSSVLVSGKTNAGAVVSISVDGNDKIEIANVDQNGNFSATVTLEEGPNFIEVLASDQQGNEESSSVAIIYVP